MREAALHAGVALVRRAVHRRADRHDPPAHAMGLQAAAHAAVAAGRGGCGVEAVAHRKSSSVLSVRRDHLDERVLGDRVGGAGVRAGAAGNAGGVHEARVEAGRDPGMEAAPGGRESERALHLVAGAHAAPAGDAQLVLQRQVGVALVVGGAAALALPARLADLEEAGHLGELGVLGGRLGELREHELDGGGRHAARGRVLGVHLHVLAARRGARGHRRRGALHPDHAHPTGPEGRQPVVEAERGHVAVRRARGLEDRRTRLDLHRLSVDLDPHRSPGSSSRRSSGRRE